ncbi:acylneuraminate cytidylyltransferase family protein [SAR202 cluster bacterium AD-802-F09_MRT_200m]|nr:acylneuraminate cytidylyltransferase family protein [SAR202 cluster bacterium AD-802-F09_MRT_200m]
MRILFLITARGGSKSVPDKNLRQLAGISLVGFRAISARKSGHCTRLIISTDSEKIQADACKYGVDVPFTRPEELATDTASSVGVISHAMTWIETESENEIGEKYDAVMLLEPSSPFTRPSDYNEAIKIMIEHDANVVVGMRETEVNSVFVGPLDQEGRITQIIDQMQCMKPLHRQALSTEYTMNGGLYLFKWDYFKEHQSIYADRDKSFGYVMDRHYSLEIDNLIDLHWAEFLVDNGYVDISYWK